MVLWAFSMALLAGIGLDGLFSYLRKGSFRRLYPLLLSVLFLAVLVVVFHFAPSVVLKVFSPFVLADAIAAKMPEAASMIIAETQRLTLTAFVILLLFLLIRKNRVSQSFGALLLCALLLADLGYVHRKAVRHDDSIYRRIAKLQGDLDASLANDKSVYRVGAFEHSLGANLEMVLGYQSVNGFTALFPSRYYDYMTRYSENHLPEGWVSLFYGVTKHHMFMDLLNVKYEILYGDKAIGFRETYLPRAFLVPDYRAAPPQEVLDILTSPDFDPRRTVILENEDEARRPGTGFQNSFLSEKVEVTTYRPDTLVLDSSSQAAGYLFLSEIHYPGWKATIDDRPAKILRGNYLFRVIPVPEGRHRIRMQFDPWTIKLGSVLSAVTLLVILASLICFLRRKRLQAKQ
jgi:hypothetical protein